MKIDLIATKDIAANEEIIIDYGSGYWKKMEEFSKFGITKKPISVQQRDARAKQRED